MTNLEAWAISQGYDPETDYAEPEALPDGYVSRHFKATEFYCNCCAQPHPTNPTPPPLALEWLENIRAHFGGKPLVISSGYRCLEHNSNVGGAMTSYHMSGMAVDFFINGVDPARVYDYVDALVGDAGGVGRYNSFTHLDTRGHRARW